MTSSEPSWPYVVNLSNSIIGVSMLALPYCLKECGIVLGCFLVLGSAWLTRISCYLLLKSAQFGRRRTYETLAMHTFGATGKLLVELCMIGLLLGTCTAFFIIIGDLAPSIVAQIIGVQIQVVFKPTGMPPEGTQAREPLGAPSTSRLRTILLIISAATIVLPLSLKRDINSLTAYSTASLAFYGVFVILLIFSCTNLFDGMWPQQVSWWQPGGTFSVMPILSLAFSCQAQVFVLYESLQDPSVKKMTGIVNSAVDLVTAVYILVGAFGYVTYHSAGVSGDVLNNYPHSFLSEALKLGFAVSVVISFPLMVFPCRVSINSLFTPQSSPDTVPDEAVLIPTTRFVYITLGIIGATLLVAICVPNVEFILQLSGCTMGIAICYIFPSFMFLRLSQEQDSDRKKGQGVALLSLLLFALCTATVFSSHSSAPVVPDIVDVKLDKPPFLCKGDNCPPNQLLSAKEQPEKAEDRGGGLVEESENAKQIDEGKKEEKRIEPVLPDDTELNRKPQPRQLQSKEPIRTTENGADRKDGSERREQSLAKSPADTEGKSKKVLGDEGQLDDDDAITDQKEKREKIHIDKVVNAKESKQPGNVDERSQRHSRAAEKLDDKDDYKTEALHRLGNHQTGETAKYTQAREEDKQNEPVQLEKKEDVGHRKENPQSDGVERSVEEDKSGKSSLKISKVAARKQQEAKEDIERKISSSDKQKTADLQKTEIKEQDGDNTSLSSLAKVTDYKTGVVHRRDKDLAEELARSDSSHSRRSRRSSGEEMPHDSHQRGDAVSLGKIESSQSNRSSAAR